MLNINPKSSQAARSLHQMGGFQDRFILVLAVRNYSKAHICTPAKIRR